MPYKLGKLPPRWNSRTLMLPKYTQDNSGSQLPAPEKIYLEYKLDPLTIGMYFNDQIGICVPAMCAHWVQLITSHTGTTIIPDPEEVKRMYSALSGWDPVTGANDNGCYITDALAYMVSTGLGGFKFDAWAQIDTKDYAKRQIAIRLFLGAGVGIQCPQSAQDQFSAKQTWTYDPNSPIEGGHGILESGEGSSGHNFATWGFGAQKATNEFDQNFTDEVYIGLTKAIVSAANDVAPKSLDYDTLVADMNALKS